MTEGWRFATARPESVRRLFYELETLGALAKITEHHGLELHPYEYCRPEHDYWIHNLYGRIFGRQVTIQIYTTEFLAMQHTAIIRIYLRFDRQPETTQDDWVLLSTQHFATTQGIVMGIQEAIAWLKRVIFMGAAWPREQGVAAST